MRFSFLAYSRLFSFFSVCVGPWRLPPSSSLLGPCRPFLSLLVPSRGFTWILGSVAVCLLPSLSCSPLPSQLRPGRPFSFAAARNFARFCRSNLQRSCALRFDSARAFLSLSGAVDYISSLHLTFQSAHFLMACVCFVSNPGIYRSRAPPSLYGRKVVPGINGSD